MKINTNSLKDGHKLIAHMIDQKADVKKIIQPAIDKLEKEKALNDKVWIKKTLAAYIQFKLELGDKTYLNQIKNYLELKFIIKDKFCISNFNYY